MRNKSVVIQATFVACQVLVYGIPPPPPKKKWVPNSPLITINGYGELLRVGG